MSKKRTKILKEKIKNKIEKIEENIHNIPNLLTLIRVIITFIILYMIFSGFSLISIVVLFTIGMITDGLDGFIARKFNQTTEFGRKFDMLADRFLLIGTVLGIFTYNMSAGIFGTYELVLILLVLTREITTFPFSIPSFFLKKHVPKVHMIGKSTTVAQAISFPMILLRWDIAVYFVAITAMMGLASGIYYINDIIKLIKK